MLVARWLVSVLCLALCHAKATKDLNPHSDVKAIILKDLGPGADYAGEKIEGGKELTLQLDGRSSKAVVAPKKSLFNKNMLIEDCGGGNCSSAGVSKEVMSHLEKCIFHGTLPNDPDSKIIVDQCNKAGIDMTLISPNSNLSVNSYRQLTNGTIKVGKYRAIAESPSKRVDASEKYASETHEKLLRGEAFLDKDGSVATVETASATHGDYGDESCCFLTNTFCMKRDGKFQCTKRRGPKLCDAEKCSLLTSKIKANAEKSLKGLEKLVASRMAETPPAPQSPQAPSAPQLPSETPAPPPGAPQSPETPQTPEAATQAPQTPEAEQTTQATSAPAAATPKAAEPAGKSAEPTGKSAEEGGSKPVSSLVLDEIKKIQKTTEKHRLGMGGKGGDMFRSGIVQAECATCRPKKKNPDKKIYTQRTVELGIYADVFLWENLKAAVQKADAGAKDDKVMDAMLTMIHSLVTSSEVYYQHKSLSDKGPISFVINGIKVQKDRRDRRAEKMNNAVDMDAALKALSEWCYAENEDWDGNPQSYDVVMLLTGRKLPGSAGLAFTNTVCKLAPAGMIQVDMDGVTHNSVAGPLFAHEIGHILGADHDGDSVSKGNTAYKGEDMIPCPPGPHLMSPTVTMAMTGWSECTRKTLDVLYDKREKDNPDTGNCFYT